MPPKSYIICARTRTVDCKGLRVRKAHSGRLGCAPGIMVEAPPNPRALVTFGDSVTDGATSTPVPTITGRIFHAGLKPSQRCAKTQDPGKVCRSCSPRVLAKDVTQMVSLRTRDGYFRISFTFAAIAAPSLKIEISLLVASGTAGCCLLPHGTGPDRPFLLRDRVLTTVLCKGGAGKTQREIS